MLITKARRDEGARREFSFIFCFVHCSFLRAFVARLHLCSSVFICGHSSECQSSNTCRRLSTATAQGYASSPGARPARPQVSRPAPVCLSIFCTRLLPNSQTIKWPSL